MLVFKPSKWLHLRFDMMPNPLPRFLFVIIFIVLSYTWFRMTFQLPCMPLEHYRFISGVPIPRYVCKNIDWICVKGYCIFLEIYYGFHLILMYWYNVIIWCNINRKSNIIISLLLLMLHQNVTFKSLLSLGGK